MTTTNKRYRLLGLRVEDYKRVTLVDLTFDQDAGLYAISGRNEQGKSSILDALEAVIAGAQAPKVPMPIRKGAESARIVATFDDLVVTRTYKGGKTSIDVRNGEGLKYADSRGIMAGLFDRIALDPIAFARMPEKEQVGVLVGLIGFDPSEIDGRIRDEEARRTEVGRERDRVAGALQSIPEPAKDTPDDEVSAAALAEQRDDVRRDIADVERTLVNAAREAMYRDERAAEVDALRQKLAMAEEVLAECVADATRAAGWAESAKARRPELVQQEEGLTLELASIDATNAAVRAKGARAHLSAEHARYVATWQQHKENIEALRAEKAAKFAGAALPVDGLTIDDGAVYVDGIPASQLSSGARIRLGFDIVAAVDPALRAIVIRDAAMLDAENLRHIDDLARERDLLVLAELVASDSEFDGVTIEDGTVSA